MRSAHRVDPGVRVIVVGDWLARWPAVPMARRLLRRLQPDIAHAHLGSACRALRGRDARDRVRAMTTELERYCVQACRRVAAVTTR